MADVAKQRTEPDGHSRRFVEAQRAADLHRSGGDAFGVTGGRAVVGRNGGGEHDQRFRRGLQVVVEPALANGKVDDPRQLGVDRDELCAVVRSASGGHAHDGDVFRRVGRDGRITLEHHDVRHIAVLREVEPCGEKLLDVRAQRSVHDRDPRHAPLAGCALR